MVDKRESLLLSADNNDTFITKTSTVFGESELGEPLVAQQVVLDFTPVSELDSEFVQAKCCAFWNYIKNRTDLRHMIVLPDEVLVPKLVKETVDSESESTPSQVKETAVSILEYNEKQGLIDRVFDTKLKQSYCALGPREYIDNEPTKPAPTKPKTCCCTKSCEMCRTVPKPKQSRSVRHSSGVQDLCQKLEAWDTKHPKSMNPPGHAPALNRCVMQRKAIT